MGVITRIELEPLLRSLDELLIFMDGLKLKKIPYFVKFIKRMKYNTQTCITIRYDRLDLLDEVLKRDWKEASNIILGASDFELPSDSAEERKRLEFRFLDLIGRIDMYVGK